MRHSHLILISLILGLWLPVTGTAQVDDPFSPSKPTDAQEVLKLNATLRVLKNDNAHLRVKIEELEKAYNEKVKQQAEREKRLAKNNAMHQRIFEQLFNSDDHAQQELALSHLVSCFENERIDSNFSLDVDKPEILRRLSELSESDKEDVQNNARLALTMINPGYAIQKGFQFGSTWEPLSRDSNSEKSQIYDALQEPVNLNYLDTPLAEIVEEFQKSFRIKIALDNDIDEATFISANHTGLEFGDSLSQLLKKSGLTYRVMNDRILILKNDDARLMKTETYNVRGLLSKKLDVDGLVKLINQNFSESQVVANTIDENRLLVKASEFDQRRVGKFLGSMTKQVKWQPSRLIRIRVK